MPRPDSDDEGGALPKRLRPVVGEPRRPDTRPRTVIASDSDPYHQEHMPTHLRKTLEEARSRKDAGQGEENARYLEAMSSHWEDHARGRRAGAAHRHQLAEDQKHEDRMLDELKYLDATRRASHERRASFASDGSDALPSTIRPPIRGAPRPESGVFREEDEPHIRRPAPATSSSRTQPAPASPSDDRKKGFGKFFHRRKKSGPGGDARSLGKSGARPYRAGEVGVTSDSDSDY
ncbi:hypothetical protein JCM9279_007179 [Rhodotorula babjevae]